jgi:hypothetical protein
MKDSKSFLRTLSNGAMLTYEVLVFTAIYLLFNTGQCHGLALECQILEILFVPFFFMGLMNPFWILVLHKRPSRFKWFRICIHGLGLLMLVASVPAVFQTVLEIIKI